MFCLVFSEALNVRRHLLFKRHHMDKSSVDGSQRLLFALSELTQDEVERIRF